MIGVILHKGGAARTIARQHFKNAQQRGSFPVAFAGETVALAHQALHRQSWKLRHAVQRLEVGGEGFAALAVEEALDADLDTRRVEHVLALLAAAGRHVAEAIEAFILVDQRVDLAVAYLINHLNQIADAPAVDRVAELDLRRDFIPFGHRHFAHIVAKARHFQLLAALLREGGAHPVADALLACRILPVAGDDAVL